MLLARILLTRERPARVLLSRVLLFRVLLARVLLSRILLARALLLPWVRLPRVRRLGTMPRLSAARPAVVPRHREMVGATVSGRSGCDAY
jgi:hypothetical protein